MKGWPGEPANSESAGITVFGGMTVLSAIFAQSLMIVNFPWRIESLSKASQARQLHAYNDAVLPNLYMAPDLRRLDDRVCTDMHVVADLHRVVVEVSPVSLVRRPELYGYTSCTYDGLDASLRVSDAPHNTALAHETVPPERNDDSMSRSSTAQVTADDRTTSDDGLAPENDILRTCYGRAPGDFVPSVLVDRSDRQSINERISNTDCLDIVSAGIVDWVVHGRCRATVVAGGRDGVIQRA
jgi:hypothetical protein